MVSFFFVCNGVTPVSFFFACKANLDWLHGLQISHTHESKNIQIPSFVCTNADFLSVAASFPIRFLVEIPQNGGLRFAYFPKLLPATCCCGFGVTYVECRLATPTMKKTTNFTTSNMGFRRDIYIYIYISCGWSFCHPLLPITVGVLTAVTL
ncbi:unnamed protein product [Camellia sinensis]